MQGEGLKKLQSGQPISTRELLLLIAQLSWPAILAQISSVVMQYIDTAMVGQLGSNASAAIGVVATTSWLFGDLCIALTIGFNVAVAQALGARQPEKARGIITAEEQMRLRAKAEELYHEAQTQPGMPYEAFNESLATKNLYPLCDVQRKSKPVGRPRKQN